MAGLDYRCLHLSEDGFQRYQLRNDAIFQAKTKDNSALVQVPLHPGLPRGYLLSPGIRSSYSVHYSSGK